MKGSIPISPRCDHDYVTGRRYLKQLIEDIVTACNDDRAPFLKSGSDLLIEDTRLNLIRNQNEKHYMLKYQRLPLAAALYSTISHFSSLSEITNDMKSFGSSVNSVVVFSVCDDYILIQYTGISQILGLSCSLVSKSSILQKSIWIVTNMTLQAGRTREIQQSYPSGRTGPHLYHRIYVSLRQNSSGWITKTFFS